jgi:hypothetical protein
MQIGQAIKTLEDAFVVRAKDLAAAKSPSKVIQIIKDILHDFLVVNLDKLIKEKPIPPDLPLVPPKEVKPYRPIDPWPNPPRVVMYGVGDPRRMGTWTNPTPRITIEGDDDPCP